MQSETILPTKFNKDLREMIRKGQIQLPSLMSTKTLVHDAKRLMQPSIITFNAKDEQLTYHQIEQNRPKTQEHYDQLWKDVNKINNNDLRVQSKAIIALTEPIQSELEKTYRQARKQLSMSEQYVKQLYLQCHNLYGQLQDSRANQAKLDLKRKLQLKELKEKFKNLLSSQLYNLLPNQEEYSAIVNRNNILKKEITELNKKVEAETAKSKGYRKKVKTSRAELIKYLREALKQGLDYREGGISWIVTELIDMGQLIQANDLPHSLDFQSKKFILEKGKLESKEMINSRGNLSTEKKGKSLKHSSKLPSLSATRNILAVKSLADILDSEQLMHPESQIKKIYDDTKQIIGKIIKDRQTTLSAQPSQTSLLVLDRQARLSSYSPEITEENNDYKEYQRVLTDYPRDIYRTVLKMEFGFRRPTMK